MDLKLKDKVALIAGGSRGIGWAVAQVLAEEGCRIGLCGRRADDVERAGADLRARGATVCAVTADVTRAEDAARFVATCAESLGGIDILVNSVWGQGGATGVLEADEADWRAAFEGNVFQAMRQVRLAVPHFRRRGGGAVVHLASISGWHPQLAGTFHYGASKAALIYATEILALELVHDRIRVNCVSPGSVFFPGGAWEDFSRQHPEAFAAYVRDGFPMGRLGRPEEIADVVAFLVSPRAHWINGRHIPVDGLEQPVPVAQFKRW